MIKKGNNHHNAQGVIGLLILAIGFVLFYKLYINQSAFADDPTALRNYVILSVAIMGFLTGLFYLCTKPHTSTKSVKVKKSSKRKKSR